MSNIDDTIDANLSRLLLHDIDFVEESFEMVKRKASEAIAQIKEARNEFEKLMLLPQGKGLGDSQFQELKKKVSKLKSSIPFNLIIPVDPPHPNVNFLPRYNPLRTQKGRTQNIVGGEGGGGGGCFGDSPYSASGRFPPPTYHELESGVRNLKILEISCLLCFLTFPESAFIKRSIFLCWVRSFRSPGFYDPSFAVDLNQAIEELIEKGFIISVIKKSSLAVSGYRMHPFVHFTLRDSHTWFPVYLSYKPFWYLGRSLDNDDDEYIYYTTESYARSLSGRKLEILYLGRWKNFTTQHIEVIDQKLFFKDMHKLSNLKFVSLRGISMIEELPKFIVELTNLKILDLKACYNLMVIPSEIANLQHSLTHLDMSECYFLDHMPKAIATLRKLQVLKGFFVGETEDERSCTIEDLKRFQVLSKLNIYTRLKEFPNRSQLRTLELLQQLRSLTISWGGCAVRTSGTQKAPQGEEQNGLKPCDSQLEQVSLMSESIFGGDEIYVFKLEKLDLQCVPDTVTEWLKPTRFRKLKKLYIRGGPFNDLGQASRRNHWNVNILRLKHLSKLNLNWVELELLFPKLERLENVNCPNLDSFPCDKDGMWIKSTRQRFNNFL